MRDRAQELLDEEANLAETLSVTWGAEGHDFPRLSLPFERLLAHTKAGATSLLASPDSPDTPQLAAAAFDPVVGDVEALAGRIRIAARRRDPRRHRDRRHRFRVAPARRARG